MHRNKAWILFLSLTMIIMGWFGFKAIGQLWTYRQLSIQVPVEVASWEIREGKGDHYLVVAHYFFEYNGEQYRGSSPVAKPFKNPWTAKKAQARFETKKWSAWLDPKNPSQSTLYKTFPSRLILSFVVLIGLVIYFVFLGLFVGRRKHGY